MNQIGLRHIRRYLSNHHHRHPSSIPHSQLRTKCTMAVAMPHYCNNGVSTTRDTVTSATRYTAHHNHHHYNVICNHDRHQRRYVSTNTTTSSTTTTTTTKTDERRMKEYIKRDKVRAERQVTADLLERDYKDTYNRDKTIYLKLCYTEYDLEEGDIVKAKFHWDSIVDVTSEEFGMETTTTSGKLEYYVDEDWVKLLPYRLYEVLQYYPCRNRKHALPVRIPSLWDDEYGTRQNLVKMKKVTPEMRKNQKELVEKGPSSQQWLMKEMIDALAKKLKADGYSPSPNSTLQNPLMSFVYHDDQDQAQMMEMSTREYILQLAKDARWKLPTPQEEYEMEEELYHESGIARPGSKTNPLRLSGTPKDPALAPDVVLQKLKFVLLSQPGALSHMTECLHLVFQWARPSLM